MNFKLSSIFNMKFLLSLFFMISLSGCSVDSALKAMGVQTIEERCAHLSPELGDGEKPVFIFMTKMYTNSIFKRQLMSIAWAECRVKGLDRRAMYHMGLRYMKGWGVPEDDRKAFDLMKKSAQPLPGVYVPRIAQTNGPKVSKGGYPGFWMAQFQLAYMYENGVGTKIDLKKAKKWHNQATSQFYPFQAILNRVIVKN